MKPFAVICNLSSDPVLLTSQEEMSRLLYTLTGEYPVFFTDEAEADTAVYTRVRLSVCADAPLSREEEYAITVKDGEVSVVGYDAAGLLYGVLDFYCKYALKLMHPTDDPAFVYIPFAERTALPDFSLISAPAVRERGLWTWGHVIYDYRAYLDNMMRLKLNRIIIWNDFPPVNAREIVAYAHERNIKVIWGYSWMWDTNCALADLSALEKAPAELFAAYERDYADIGGDGIYFQTFTELCTEYIGDRLIADAAVDLVNRTVALFYEKYPNLEIQFGLHTDSVRDRLSFIEKTDPRVRIVWENCGTFPLAGTPSPTPTGELEDTLAYLRRIASLRGANDRFGVVTKGIIGLDWTRFKHLTSPQFIGVSTPTARRARAEARRPHLRAIVAGWLAHADSVLATIRTLAEEKRGDVLVAALVEDGMFEENILYPVALEAEMLWSPASDLKVLMRDVALREYVTFAE